MDNHITGTCEKKVRLLSFFYNGNRFGFDSCYLRSIVPIEGSLEKVKDVQTIESHLGLVDPHTDMHYEYCLNFKGEGNVISKILINGPIELVELSAGFIYEIPQLVHSRVCYSNLLALGEIDEAFFFLLKI